ncbi:MAG: hypothetical protein AAF298_13755 [Cyanobacteria bacterium P01_A01_bin.40]
MDKFSLSKSSVDDTDKSFANFITTVLILLITFNFGWLLMFIRLYNRLAVVRNLNKTLFNLESLLLLGNLSMFLLFVAYALGTRSLREILGRRN